jgi:hypothetical protein
MKKATVFSLLFMVIVLFILAFTVEVSYAAVDPHGFLGLKFGDNKKIVEKKLLDRGFAYSYYNKNNTDAIVCDGGNVLGKTAFIVGCYFFENRLKSIKVVWSLLKAPDLQRALKTKYGAPDVIESDKNLLEWYVGDTMITLFLDENDYVSLIYSSMSIFDEEIEKESRGIENSL